MELIMKVKELRKKTGAGWHDIVSMLNRFDGDVVVAEAYLKFYHYDRKSKKIIVE